MDFAATTPLERNVLQAMITVFKKNYFNPGGLYNPGVVAAKKIAECRKSVANLLGTTNSHVVFTRGGTESNNMAIMGVVNRYSEMFPEKIPHVIVSEIEHSAVLETVKYLEKNKKITLSVIPVNEEGVVDVDEIKQVLKSETILVSVMYVNNEIGTIQPIKEITKLIRWYKKQKFLQNEENYPLVHTDAIQSTNYLDINVERLGVDLMSLSGSKIYGPKSSGILYVRNMEMVSALFHGGNQELKLRAGTEDIAQIVGFTKAFEIARAISEQESVRLVVLQNYFLSELEKKIQGLKINGSRKDRVCNNINVSIPEIPSERLIIELDAQGIYASSKSACRTDESNESYVIKALRKNNQNTSPSTEGSIRFTMGKSTTKKDIDRTIRKLVTIVTTIRNFNKNML